MEMMKATGPKSIPHFSISFQLFCKLLSEFVSRSVFGNWSARNNSKIPFQHFIECKAFYELWSIQETSVGDFVNILLVFTSAKNDIQRKVRTNLETKLLCDTTLQQIIQMRFGSIPGVYRNFQSNSQVSIAEEHQVFSGRTHSIWIPFLFGIKRVSKGFSDISRLELDSLTDFQNNLQSSTGNLYENHRSGASGRSKSIPIQQSDLHWE